MLIVAALLCEMLAHVGGSSPGPENFTPAGQRIYGGEEVGVCGWPSVVSLTSGSGACTGTLIHPELVVYAAHCGDSFPSVHFGETRSGGSGKTVWTDYCKLHHVVNKSNLGGGSDIAYCKLAEPVSDVPIVPPLMGCESSVLYPGAEVVAVGFGETEEGTYDVKRAVDIKVNQVGVEISAGGLGEGTCVGDSGGPLFIHLTTELNGDGTWRVFGITSFGPPGCNGGSNFGTMFHNMVWLEEDSGLDLTPCTDAEGEWDPDARCQQFPMDPASGGGSWESACEAEPLSPGFGETCGPALAEDLTAPTVALVAPESGSYPSDSPDGAAFDIEAEAADEGWGIAQVQLRLDGEVVASDSTAPYTWPVLLGSGQYVLDAVAIDLAGNEALSEPVYLGVDMDTPLPPKGDDEESGSEGSQTSSGDEPGQDGASGCTCTLRNGPRPNGCLLWMCALLGRRRSGLRFLRTK